MNHSYYDPDLNDKTIYTSRLFETGPTEIFDLFSTPEYLVEWWAPKGYTHTLLEFNFQPGGKWRHTSTSPEGDIYTNEATFVYIAPNEQILFKHISPAVFTTQIILEHGVPNHTTLHWLLIFDSVIACEQAKSHAIIANNESLNRLEHQLAMRRTNTLLTKVQKIIKK